MRRDARIKVIQLFFVCLIIIISIFGYLNVNSKENSTILVGKRLSSEKNSSIKLTNDVFSPFSDNYISVAGITNDLMHDPQGEHLYLNHNKQGIYDGIGVPYMDYRHNLTGKKTIIYAHSIKNGNGPFQMLQNYHNDFDFYQKHRYITIHYEGQTYTYVIFSVYVSLADNEESEGLEFFHRNYYNEEEWYQTLLQYKNYSEYNIDVDLSPTDHIVILQTCSMDDNYFEKYYRYNLLIMGKQVS